MDIIFLHTGILKRNTSVKRLRVREFVDDGLLFIICSIYNMSGRVVSDIQTRAEGERLYIRYNTAAHVVNSM